MYHHDGMPIWQLFCVDSIAQEALGGAPRPILGPKYTYFVTPKSILDIFLSQLTRIHWCVWICIRCYFGQLATHFPEGSTNHITFTFAILCVFGSIQIFPLYLFHFSDFFSNFKTKLAITDVTLAFHDGVKEFRIWVPEDFLSFFLDAGFLYP